jgi:hypothetical protein
MNISRAVGLDECEGVARSLYRKNGLALANRTVDGWLTQARFWLELECSTVVKKFGDRRNVPNN